MTSDDDIRKIQGDAFVGLPRQKPYKYPKPPVDPLAEYEVDGVFDTEKYLAHKEEKSAAVGMIKALERGDASALSLHHRLKGDLDRPPEMGIELNADEIARISFNADRRIRGEPDRVESLPEEC